MVINPRQTNTEYGYHNYINMFIEKLCLSVVNRKYDIPYPTFVLYANRVHNMLGPSADGGAGEC